MANVLVTGAAGYIGSHTCLVLLEAGHEVVVIDNLSNGSLEAIRRVEKLSGRGVLEVCVGDVADRDLVRGLLVEHQIDSVIHFAAFKAVGESVQKPLLYYGNNVGGTLALLDAMASTGVCNLVFSSSATVYGDPDRVPIREDFPTRATNPYGWSKWMTERILCDAATADPEWRFTLLRYFNPVGAHPSGTIGEDPRGIPNNLMPYVSQVAVGRRDALQVFGDDYPTVDGTGVRDYIHVMDLARGHLLAVERMTSLPSPAIINLGTGRGYSVLEVLKAFETASGRRVPYRVVARRPGDIASCWADASLAEHLLGWQAEMGIDKMCEDAWRWQSLNPDGYAGQ